MKGQIPEGRDGARPALITGGCGFIGSNVAHALLATGRPVLLLDNLSRAGVEQNLRWLQEEFGDRVRLIQADIRDAAAVHDAVSQASQVFHFAAQVAVTTSLADPREDFTINAGGTLNVLEAVRAQDVPPPLLFTSTNKVYGGLEDIPLQVFRERYYPVDDEIRSRGIDESRTLDFHSPYGCSKGSADQYVIDYARSYGIPAVVFRMSCIYGPRQFGTEDQGWVAHFLIRALRGEPITLYGDGMQVRDILFIEDLVRAMLLAQQRMPVISGRAFNIGGGPNNALSLLNLLHLIGELRGECPRVAFEEWRTGDQRYYVSDTDQFSTITGWTPKVDAYRGIERLYEWLKGTVTAQAVPSPSAPRRADFADAPRSGARHKTAEGAAA